MKRIQEVLSTENAGTLNWRAVVPIIIMTVKYRVLIANAEDLIHGELLRHESKYGTPGDSYSATEPEHPTDDVTLKFISFFKKQAIPNSSLIYFCFS